ncbi:radial spoke head protein 3 homolog B isoform X1 [Cydia pomonella]|uniref:radial spoke head protein 3 homolog B isoform X1 n=1 Tax=Cydia pomonella TaxID=82600 RepID=UPI002ADE8E45|nr:radial spoke head protein 3 homolog B isoform X1 [Cydia pomonella]
MPPVDLSEEAFTVLQEPRVNVVRPLPRADMVAPTPHSLLDPKFSRALDFKLRRLKEKEILQANLRRPTRRARAAPLAASNPSLGSKAHNCVEGMSRSHPRIDVIAPEEDASPSGPPAEASPSPGRGSRRAKRHTSPGERPRFVTTVKVGQFLPPPPELAELLGLESLYPAPAPVVYSYASRPKAVAGRCKRAAPERKEAPAPKRPAAGDVFSGVRALIAGVAGLRHMVEQSETAGSMATSGGGNIMHDKRVVRGSTFAVHPQSHGDGIESAAAKAARTRRRALARRAAAARLRPGTPPPAPGRRHHPIQTEYYLEELFDKGVEMEVGVQTDLFLDRPATPVYVPAKTGADAATQIYPGDLFDFDLEVSPILEVLVGKTSEQALAEVAQEEELATLREQQRRYAELRDAERAERQRLAAMDQRLYEEKERRVAEARVAQVAAEEARARAAAATLVQGYVAELLPAVLAGLRDQGYLLERVHRGVDEEFMPWLVNAVSEELDSIITSRDVITEIVRDVVEARNELYRAAAEAEAQVVEPEESITPPSTHEEEEEEAEVTT